MIGSKVFWENDLRLRMKNLSEMAVSLQGKTSIFTYRTLISSCVGGARTNPPTYEIWAYFLMCLALNVPIFNKKSHRTRAMINLQILTKVWKFPHLVSVEIFVKNWHTKSQGLKKNCPHFLQRWVRPFPSHTAGN